MAFASFRSQQDASAPTPMAEINVTPMVDVMLVLLVIFIMTAPLFTHAVKLDLPSAKSTPLALPSEPVVVSINSAGAIYWNQTQVNFTELSQHLQSAAILNPQPELQLRADKATRYETIAQVMAAAQTTGLRHIGFLTEAKDN